MIVKGANHLSIAYPPDPTAARGFLGFPTTQPEDQIRSLIAQTIGLLIDVHVRHQSSVSVTLEQLLETTNPLISSFERR